MTKELNNEIEEVVQEENLNEKAIERVVVGKNDVFKKTYYFEEIHLRVYLNVKFPTFRERAKIKALRSDILYGTEQNSLVTMAYEMLFMIQESGKDTKVYLTDENNNDKQLIENYFNVDSYPREDVLLKVADDLNEWANRFPG